jgi:hypothetical protein
MTLKLTFIALLSGIALPCLAQVNITGRVLSEVGEALPGAAVQVGDTMALSDATGHFSLSADPAEIHMLRYSAENHFPMVHSYSPLEFAWQQETSSADTIVVPDELPGFSRLGR